MEGGSSDGRVGGGGGVHSHCHVAGLALRQVLLWSDQHRLREESAVPLPESLDVLLVIDHLQEELEESGTMEVVQTLQKQSSHSFVLTDPQKLCRNAANLSIFILTFTESRTLLG